MLWVAPRWRVGGRKIAVPHSLLEYCWVLRLTGFVHPNIWKNPCSKRRLRWRETLCSAQCCHIARNGCFNISKASAPCCLAKAAMPVTHFWGIVCFCWQFVSALLWKQLNLSCCSCRALALWTVPLSFQAIDTQITNKEAIRRIAPLSTIDTWWELCLLSCRHNIVNAKTNDQRPSTKHH